MARLSLEDALKFYPSFSQEDIAVLSDTPIYLVRQQIKNKRLELKHEPSPLWQTEVMLEDLTMEQIAKKHNTTPHCVKQMLYDKFPSGPREQASHQQIINFMVENRGKYTQVELAERFGCSQSLIAKLNPFKQPIGKIERKSPAEWKVILDYARKHSIQAAALTYKVSRTAIYNRMDK